MAFSFTRTTCEPPACARRGLSVSTPVTNTLFKPARNTGVAVLVGDWAIGQLWLFWVAPIVGAVLGAVADKAISPDEA